MTNKSFDLGAIVQIGFVSGLQVANRQARGYVMFHTGTNNYYAFVPHKGLTRYGQTTSDFRAALAGSSPQSGDLKYLEQFLEIISGFAIITLSIYLLSKTIYCPDYRFVVGIVGGFFIFFAGLFLIVVPFLRF